MRPPASVYSLMGTSSATASWRDQFICRMDRVAELLQRRAAAHLSNGTVLRGARECAPVSHARSYLSFAAWLCVVGRTCRGACRDAVQLWQVFFSLPFPPH